MSKRTLDNLVRRLEAKPRTRVTLDPLKPLGGNAVAYFDIDGDPESVALINGDNPVEIVMNIIRKRLKNNNGKAQHGQHPDEILVHFINSEGKPASFTTKVKVLSRWLGWGRGRSGLHSIHSRKYLRSIHSRK
jgi:hypothetical protein